MDHGFIAELFVMGFWAAVGAERIVNGSDVQPAGNLAIFQRSSGASQRAVQQPRASPIQRAAFETSAVATVERNGSMQ